MAEAGSSPTSTVARPGVTASSATSRATSCFTRAATALPSMITARQPTYRTPCAPAQAGCFGLRALLERRVVRHELALGAVRGEAHHHETAGLHAHHHALAERGVGHVVAQREDRPRPARLGRRGGAAAPGGRGLAAHRPLLLAVGQ